MHVSNIVISLVHIFILSQSLVCLNMAFISFLFLLPRIEYNTYDNSKVCSNVLVYYIICFLHRIKIYIKPISVEHWLELSVFSSRYGQIYKGEIGDA